MYIPCLFFCLLLFSCKKNEFLEEKPDSSLAVPETLADCQQLLDNDIVMNYCSSVGWSVSDDYIIETPWVPRLSAEERALYTFQKEPFASGSSKDWNLVYRIPFYANEVLAILPGIPVNNDNAEWHRRLKGAALFYRAFAHTDMLHTFAKQYDPATAATDPGIPLRLEADINEPIFRSTVQDCYDQIEADLKEALLLLPDKDLFPTRPTRPAAFALLARNSLMKADFPKAHAYADSCLAIRNELMDYNGLVWFPTFNEEVLFHCVIVGSALIEVGSINPALLALYADNDLRISKLFLQTSSRGTTGFKGSYTGIFPRFGGLAVDEVLLIRAETAARMGDGESALADLNRLVEKRMKTGTFVKLEAASSEEVLSLILLERRKEMLFRSVRQLDLRRLNKEGRSITVQRELEGSQYILEPGSRLYAFPIPPQVMDVHPDMPQNER